MRRALIITAVVLLLCGVVWGRAFYLSALNQDAVHVIALEVARLVEEGGAPSRGEVDALACRLIEASVIRGRSGSEGEPPTSVSGHPFEVEVRDEKLVVCSTRGVWGLGGAEASVPLRRAGQLPGAD